MAPLSTRIYRFFRTARLVIIQTIQRNIISLKQSYLFSPTTQPNAWKNIADRPYLYPSRIFRPKTGHGTPTPLIIMMHGGGFIMNNPSVDDRLARFLSDSCRSVVVSIDYRKAPRFQFPDGYEDAVESTLALLGDGGKDLDIDRSKVAFVGSSAGANLALGAAQDPRLQGKAKAVVAIYPTVDVVPTAEEKLATRPDPSVPDFIGPMWDGLKDVYVGTDDAAVLRDVRLSPTYYKQREDLPVNMYLIGCEHDMFCREAKVMAERLAGKGLSDQQRGERQWSVGKVRWMMVKGQGHGFDHFGIAKETKAEVEARLRQRDALYESIADWLRNVFSAVET